MSASSRLKKTSNMRRVNLNFPEGVTPFHATFEAVYLKTIECFGALLS